jgi:hypothetical protein
VSTTGKWIIALIAFFVVAVFGGLLLAGTFTDATTIATAWLIAVVAGLCALLLSAAGARNTWQGGTKKVRVLVLTAMIALGTLFVYVFWNAGGYGQESSPPTQSVQVFVGGSPSDASVTLSATLAPHCPIEKAGCERAQETLDLDVTPLVPQKVDWLLVIQPGTDATQLPKGQGLSLANVYLAGSRSPEEVWIASGTTATRGAGCDPHSAQGKRTGLGTSGAHTDCIKLDVAIAARHSDRLVVAIPQLLDQEDPTGPTDPCGVEVGFEPRWKGTSALLEHPLAGGSLTWCTTALDPANPVTTSPLTPIGGAPFAEPFYGADVASATATLDDRRELDGFSLDSSAGATLTGTGFQWQGGYGTAPEVFATDVSGEGRVARYQLLAGVLIGLLLAAALGLVQEYTKPD